MFQAVLTIKRVFFRVSVKSLIMFIVTHRLRPVKSIHTDSVSINIDLYPASLVIALKNSRN